VDKMWTEIQSVLLIEAVWVLIRAI